MTIRTAKQQRFLAVDALRGIAAVWVMVYHYTWPAGDVPTPRFPDPCVMIPFGEHAVDLFFMISGFVITMTAERRKNVMDFAFGRFARLYPVYWAALTLICVLQSATQMYLNGPSPPIRIAANFTMLQRAFGVANIDEAFWSLYVELAFYAVVAACLATCRWQWLQPVMLTISALSVLAVIGDFRDHVPGWWRIDQGFPLLKPAHLFAYGIALFELSRGRRRWLIPTLALGLVHMVLRLSPTSFIVVATSALAMFLATSGHLNVLERPSLVWLGAISYSVYLMHGCVGNIIRQYGTAAGLDINLSVVLATATTLLTASLLTFLVERPAQVALMHWWRKPAPRQEALESRTALFDAEPAVEPVAAAFQPSGPT